MEKDKVTSKLGKLKESFEAEQRSVTNLKAREISELKSQLSKREDELRNHAHQLKLRQDEVEELETKTQDLKVGRLKVMQNHTHNQIKVICGRNCSMVYA